MNLAERLTQIDALSAALCCPALVEHLNAQIHEHTERLIGADHEQTRGRIKALRALLTLPDELQQERDGITAALSE